MARLTRTLMLTTLVLATAAAAARAGSPDAASESFFELKVRPVLAGTCVKCHGEKKASGGLRLDSREAMLAGGENGPAVVPGDPQGSLLIQAVRHADETLKMPPEQAAAPRRAGRPGRVGRRRCALAEGRRVAADRGPGALGVRAAPGRRAARRPDRLGLAADRPVHRRRPPGQRAAPGRAGRPPDLDPPGVLRPDRPAARARAGRGVRRRRAARRLRAAGRRAARLAPATASAGDATGSTSPAMPTPPATTPTTRSRRRTSIATT